MTKFWSSLFILAILPGLVMAQVTDDRYVIKRTAATFQGSCRTGQIGMAPPGGETYVCVSGQWRRNDLPSCGTTAPTGTCDTMSMCLHRSTMALYGCSATNVWSLLTAGSGGTGGEGEFNYSQSFSDQTSVNLNHTLGTPNVLVSCYDSSDIQIAPDSVDIAAADPWDVTVTFEVAQTGRCVVNGSGNGSSGGGGSGGTGGYPDLREDGAARVNDAEYIDFLSGLDVSSSGQVSLDYTERPINLASSEVTGTLSIARGGTSSTSFTPNTCIRYNGSQLVSAATDCGSGGGSGCTDIDNDCLADNAEDLTCTTGCVTLNTETAGVLNASQGGTGISAPSYNRIIVGNEFSTAWVYALLPSCSNAVNSKLLYNDSTQQFSCGVDQSSGSGSSPQGPEGAIQFYEGGVLGSNAGLYWTEATSVLRSVNIEASGLWRGTGLNARWDLDRDSTYDLELSTDSTAKAYLGFRQDASYLRWPTFAVRPNGINYLQLDFTVGDGTDSAVAGDFCIRQNGIDSDCNGTIDFNSNPAQHDVMVGNASAAYTNRSMPDCDGTGSGNSLNYSTTSGTFSCRTITGGAGSSWALGLDYGADGTNVQVDVDGTTVDVDPDADGTLEARVNADGSIETFGAADESGGMASNGKLIFTADDNNNGTGEGMDWDVDGDGSYEFSASGTGTLAFVTGAVIPGVCASVASATSITADDCNVVTLTGSTPITSINTCNAANLGRQLLVLCNSFTSTLGEGGNMLLGAATRSCATGSNVLTLVCNGTNWLEVAWAAN